MKRGIKWIIGIVGISTVVAGLAFAFSWGILKATPWLYNTFGTGIHVEQNLDKTKHRSNESSDENPFAILGTFGDSAGLFNAVFSGLAFAAVVLTFIWQWNKEDEKDKQTKKAQFEANFFSMTTMLENIIANLTLTTDKGIADPTSKELEKLYKGNNPSSEGGNSNSNVTSGKEVKGRAIFKYLYSERDSITGIKGIKQAVESGLDMDEIRETFYDAALDHYFRYLYRILKYVDGSDLLKDEERQGYASILRAQLSGYELLVWFYNCLSLQDNTKVKGLIEIYAMFNNLRWKLLAHDDKFERYSRIFKDENYKDDECSNETYAIGAFKKEETKGVAQITYTPCGSFEFRFLRKKCSTKECPLEKL